MVASLNQRARSALTFIAEMQAVSVLHLAQFLAPNFEPAVNTHLAPTHSDTAPVSKRGGDRRHAPWPLDHRLRLKAVSRLINNWKKAGWIGVEAPWSGEPVWVYATKMGLDRLGLSYSSASFPEGEDELEHLFQITRVRLYLGHIATQQEGAFPHTWISERTIESTFPRKTEGITLPHLPDGLMEVDAVAKVRMADHLYIPCVRGDRIAIEIERTRKSFVRLHSILPSLLQEYQGVWYFARPKAADAVLKEIANLVEKGTFTPEQAKLIRVINLEQI